MTDQHPITPPPELLRRLREEAPRCRDGGAAREEWIATQAAQWGADQELEACCNWLPKLPPWSANDLRKHRRSKPPSLKEQALDLLDRAEWNTMTENLGNEKRFGLDEIEIIRRALEALDD